MREARDERLSTRAVVRQITFRMRAFFVARLEDAAILFSCFGVAAEHVVVHTEDGLGEAVVGRVEADGVVRLERGFCALRQKVAC